MAERKYMIKATTLEYIAEKLEGMDDEARQVAAACRGLAEGMCHDDGICGDGDVTWFEHGV